MAVSQQLAPRRGAGRCGPTRARRGGAVGVRRRVPVVHEEPLLQEPGQRVLPPAIVAIVLASTLTALGALCACWRMRSTIRRLEAELAVAVDTSRRAKSHIEGVSLMAEGASPGAPDRAEEPDELVVRSGLSGRVCRMPSHDTHDSPQLQEHEAGGASA